MYSYLIIKRLNAIKWQGIWQALTEAIFLFHLPPGYTMAAGVIDYFKTTSTKAKLISYDT